MALMTTALKGERVVLVSFDSCDPKRTRVLAANEQKLGKAGLQGGENSMELSEEALSRVRHHIPSVDGDADMQSPLHPVGTLKSDGHLWHVFFEIAHGSAPVPAADESGVELVWDSRTALPVGEDGKRVAGTVSQARAALARLTIEMAALAEAILTPDALGDGEI